MKSFQRKKSIVDSLFLLLLFGAFLLSALFIVLFGARIYQKTADTTNRNFGLRTSVSYITEKIHQMDSLDGVSVLPVDGTEVLRLTTVAETGTYYTYLYYYDGYLKELTASESMTFRKENGTDILELQDLTIKQISPSLLYFEVTTKDNEETAFFVSHTRGKEAN